MTKFSPTVKLQLVAFLSYNVGVAVGYYMAKSYYKKKYKEQLEMELALSEHYVNIKKARKASEEREEEIFEAEIIEILEEDDGNPYNIPWDPCDLDYDEEMKYRSNEAPYVISKNEFDNDEPNYEKISLEYYASEEVLLDDRIEPMAESDLLVGDANLKRFGHGSGDRRLVYIRNDELETDWEVRLMMGSYLIDVLGLDDPNDTGKRYERTD